MASINTLTRADYTNRLNTYNAYIFNVTWADSSTGKVRMAWVAGDYNGVVSPGLYISIVDTDSNDWQISNPQ